MRKKAGKIFNLAAVGLLLAVSISSGCSKGETSNSNTPNSPVVANSNAAPAAPSASPAKKIESFTADSLIEALKNNQSEVDDRLAYEEISISGPVKVVDNHNIEFSSKDGGKVNCSLSIDADKAVVDKLYAAGRGGSLPVATAIGTYKLSVPPSSKPNWYVGLNQCRIEASGT